MLVEFSQANLLQKARQQPDKVKQVLDKMRTDGIVPTLEAVFRKLDEPLPLGYCNAGTVLAVGEGVESFAIGDRVVSNGPHAEIVQVPVNLCAKVPEGVSDEDASFTVLGAIALQGIRLAQPTLGERFVVFGMGLLGLLTVQLLRTHGCQVLGIDMNAARLSLAEEFGAKTVDLSTGADPVRAIQAWTNGTGADGAIITASAKSDDIMHQAASGCRKRGRLILVGVVGLNLRRSDFFEKELTFQVSCSYGPGRYDEQYEQQGRDYPIGYVRWTEQRNFEAVLETLGNGSVQVGPLVTHRFALGDALSAYEKIQSDGSALGVILQYPQEANLTRSVVVNPAQNGKVPDQPGVGLIGAGAFARAVLLPALKKSGAPLVTLAARKSGVSLVHAARKFSAAEVTTDSRAVLEDFRVGTVFIATGHHVHAPQVVEALDAGKHVFVEKPLALNREQLDTVREAVTRHPDLHLMVGFNRRFSPHTRHIQSLLRGRSEPLALVMTVNAGEIPPDTWIQDPERGGGRIIGEACHFLDLMVALTGAPITSVAAMRMGEGPAVRDDKMVIVLQFGDGSIGTLNYLANGSKKYPKELLEVFSDGRVIRMENFRRTVSYGFKSDKPFKTLRQDKGHETEVSEFLRSVRTGGQPLIPFTELENVTLATFAAMQSAREGKVVHPASVA